MHQLGEWLYKHWQSLQANKAYWFQILLKGFLVYCYQRLHIQHNHNRGRKMLWQWLILLKPSSSFGFLVEEISKCPIKIAASYISLYNNHQVFPQECGEVTFLLSKIIWYITYLYFYKNYWEWIRECYVTKCLRNQPYFFSCSGSFGSFNGTLKVSIFWAHDYQKFVYIVGQITKPLFLHPNLTPTLTLYSLHTVV